MQNEINLPYSLESEQSVLGAILTKPDILPHIKLKLDLEDFYFERHREIYKAIVSPGEKDMVSVWGRVKPGIIESS